MVPQSSSSVITSMLLFRFIGFLAALEGGTLHFSTVRVFEENKKTSQMMGLEGTVFTSQIKFTTNPRVNYRVANRPSFHRTYLQSHPYRIVRGEVLCLLPAVSVI
ncbi:hypothetical protein DFH06DRAFT_1210951, partial [Mycena polygramma]